VQPTVNHPECDPPVFPIVLSSILKLHSRHIEEHSNGIFKRNAMLDEVLRGL